jgi:hypothetical protein
MAVAVVVDVQSGLSNLPHSVLSEGLKALRSGLPQAEHPEVVVACDLLAVGSSIRIPGVRVVGIISQGNDEPVLPLSIPCVTGVPDLLRSVGDEEIAIVDGSEGVVHLDPDVQTIIYHQNKAEPPATKRLFLESAHLPARTPDGRVVSVAAIASTVDEVELAISQGADMLVVDFTGVVSSEVCAAGVRFLDPEVEVMELVVAMTGDKPVVLVVDGLSDHLGELAERLGVGDRVSFTSPEFVPRMLSEIETAESVCAGSTEVTVSADMVARTKESIRGLPQEDTDQAYE